MAEPRERRRAEPEPLAYRAIERDDIDELAALITDAFGGYRAFAPTGWQPPAASEQIRGFERWIGDPDYWGEVAAGSEMLVGCATLIPAARHQLRGASDPALAHLGHLFVRPAYWGTGVATELLARAIAAAVARELTAIRLFVPVGQARARSFYARAGFTAVGEPFDLGIGLPVLEYARSL